MRCLMLLLTCSALAAAQGLDDRPSLVHNGTFDVGLASWTTAHAWYEQPQGSGNGTSVFTIDAGGHDGRPCARVDGEGRRGIIMQDLPVSDEPLRLSGWIRCEDLGEAAAMIQIEWLGAGNEYLGASPAGSVVGDADWTRVSVDLTPPEGAALVHIECATTTNNSGRAWFDDVRLVSLTEADQTPPPPLKLRVHPSPWVTGALHLEWAGYDPPTDIGLYRVYVSHDPFDSTQGLTPVIEVGGSATSALIRNLQVGQAYSVAVVPTDRYGNVPDSLQTLRATPTTAGAPLLTVTPLAASTGALGIRVTPGPGVDPPRAYAIAVEYDGKQRIVRSAGDGRAVITGLPRDTEVRLAVADGFEARFVSYVPVRSNSRATPVGELLRQAPDDFPDELSDDAARDLPAERTQPIFLTFAAALEAHLRENDWLDIANVHIADEPIPINLESWKVQSDLIHQAAPELRRMDAIHVPDLRGFCELWVPQLNYFDQWHEQYTRWQKAGEYELWFYVAWVPQGKYPNRLIDTEAIKPRIVHWLNYLYGASGYLHWGLNHWHIKFGTFSPGDEWMVWPGRDGPNPSIRYEAQRDGLEDCEYLAMLEDAERKVIETLGAKGFIATDRPHEIARRVVRSMTDYTRSYKELQSARAEILRDLAAASTAPLAIVRTQPTTSAPVEECEVEVFGQVEPGCVVTVDGAPVTLDGNRFQARAPVTETMPDITIVVRKAREMKRIVRRFTVVAR